MIFSAMCFKKAIQNQDGEQIGRDTQKEQNTQGDTEEITVMLEK